jgi:predicted transcriptional regulator
MALMTSETPQPEIHASTPLLLRHLQAADAQTARQLEVALGDVDQIGPEQIEEWIRWATDDGLIEPTGGGRYNITARGQGIIGPPDYAS